MAPVLAAGFAAGLGGFGGIAGLGSAAGITVFGIGLPTILANATLIAGAVALNYALQPGTPDPEQGTIPLKQTVPPRFCGFGEVRLAGVFALYESRYGAAFTIVALAQGPAGGFKKLYLHENAVTTTAAGIVNELPGGAYGDSRVYISGRLGSAAETALPITQLSDIWTADHRGDGVVQLQLTCSSVKAEELQKIYPNGHPRQSAVVFLPCWDFRDPAQDPDNANTWVAYAAWNAGTTYAKGARVLYGGIAVNGISPYLGGMLWLCDVAGTLGTVPGSDARVWKAVWKNPVLQVVTYITNADRGMGLPREILIDPVAADLTNEAAKAHAAIQKADGSWEETFTSCPWWRMDTEPTEVLGMILASCDGWAGLNGDGALALRVGTYEAPTEVIDDSMIIDAELSYGVEDEDKVDELTLTYTSPEHDYTTQAVEPWRNEAMILNRGEARRTQAFGPQSVQSGTQMRRLAKRMMDRANADRVMLKTHMGGIALAGHRYARVQSSLFPELSNAVVEIRRRETQFSDRACMFETVIVNTSAASTWAPATEQGAGAAIPTRVVREAVPVPQNVLGDLSGDATNGYRFDLSWDDPPNWTGLTYVVEYRTTTLDSEWLSAQVLSPNVIGGRVFATIFPTILSESWELRIASRTASGTLSAWSESAYLPTNDALRDDAGRLFTDDAGEFTLEEV